MTAPKGNAHGEVGAGTSENVSRFYHSPSDYVGDFQEAIRSAGLEPPEVIADGHLHRFASNGKRGDEAGWYVLHGDGVPAGVFGNWRTGFTQTWRADIGRKLTSGEESENRARWEAMRRQREQEQVDRHQKAQADAERIWQTSAPAPEDHPYLARKGVHAYGVRIHHGSLVIPAHGRDGRLTSLQFIGPNGNKRFLPGGKMQGGHFIICVPAGVLCIVEGFATGATVYEATGYGVAVAFNAGNLLPVAKAMRDKYPDAKIIICADDDHRTEGNPGLTKAKEAAREIGAMLSVPLFGSARPAAATDFNDLARLSGIDAVREQILWI